MTHHDGSGAPAAPDPLLAAHDDAVCGSRNAVANSPAVAYRSPGCSASAVSIASWISMGRLAARCRDVRASDGVRPEHLVQHTSQS